MNRKATHPGIILRKYYMRPRGVSVEMLSNRIGESLYDTLLLLRGRLDVDKRIARRLAIIFRTTIKYWLNLQENFDGSKYGKTGE